MAGQLHRLAVASDLRRSWVLPPRAVPQLRRELSARSPDQTAQPRQELLHLEGLGEVVVRAAVDAAYFLAPASAGGENQHRHADPAGAPALEQRQPVDTRQPEIENDRVVWLGAGEEVAVLSVRSN